MLSTIADDRINATWSILFEARCFMLLHDSDKYPPIDRSIKLVNILHIEDSALDHALFKRALAAYGINAIVMHASTLDAACTSLQKNHCDVVVVDYRLGDFNAIDVWNEATSMACTAPFILLSGAIGETAVAQALRTGIHDFVHKDDLHTIGRVIERTLAWQKLQTEKKKTDAALQQSQQQIAELVQHLQKIAEDERTAFARDLHDEIGGTLTATRLELAWLQRHVNDAQFKAHVDAACLLVQNATLACQRIMQELRPPVLDDGLTTAVEWLARGHEQRNSSPVHLRVPPSLATLPENVMLAVYRTVQEALTNVSKYAYGSSVQIDLENSGGALTVEISDNGPGFSPEARSKPSSYGLRGLQERAQAVGGWLDIHSTLGRGTCLTLTIPLSMANDNLEGLDD
ncbi:response regulator [Curvibacter sp. CHRR-16]|uniref:hybrid sensor histidine kinase/response regulator n=1 Tax=Curvibacter sp. CHRR-16 TaxID=2835872 RepID=UPI001BD9CDA1|nr:ATP-binding protein [Curvibacter sp. CHRR-16]MBT0569510.1 response regulator [Curvibacter sp. CHRR-16]